MRLVVAMLKKYVKYNKLSIKVVAGPSDASCTVAVAAGHVHPTTVVSTKLNNGSDNQMRIVVPQKMSNWR